MSCRRIKSKATHAILLCLITSILFNVMPSRVAAASDLNLSLKYNFGGCKDELYTPEAYWVTPIVKDIYKNGKNQIIFGNYSIIVLDAASGSELWRVNGGYDRTKPYEVVNGDVGRVNKIVVADIDGDGFDEIIAAHGNGWVSALTYDGYMKPGWPQQLHFSDGSIVTRDVRSLHVDDLDNDGKQEVVAGAATSSAENVWVYSYDGKLLPGWPQLSHAQNAKDRSITDPSGAYSYGVFMDGVTAGDINGDGFKEILVALDDAYICAYDIEGTLVSANPEVFGNRAWGKVALYEDYSYENSLSEARKKDHNFNQGFGYSYAQGRSQLYRGELGHGAVRVVDIDNCGKNEVVVTAIIADRRNDQRNKVFDENDLITSRYMGVFIFNGDRTRYEGWEKAPSDIDFMGSPLSIDSKTLALDVQSVPVIADLEGNGSNQVIVNTYDGKIHAFSINDPSKEFEKFPFTIPQQEGAVELPNEVVCVDIDGCGKKEIIFTTNTRTHTGEGDPAKNGSLYILNSDGTLRASAPIPDGYIIYETKKPAYSNASMSAPAVADIDGDGQYEIIINTKYSGICVFETGLS